MTGSQEIEAQEPFPVHRRHGTWLLAASTLFMVLPAALCNLGLRSGNAVGAAAALPPNTLNVPASFSHRAGAGLRPPL